MSDTPTDDFQPTMTDNEALMWRIGADPWLEPSGSLLAVLAVSYTHLTLPTT